ncbi:MAG: NAD-dependent DNA ligase LigA [Clostridiales Family XIII bacterium]|jgi:DNA ligase (NAD+)|nr:NAD-dependent DNA ligase LigA [Clostridiales Family XIII bacterium]
MEKDLRMDRQRELTALLTDAARAYYDDDWEMMSNLEYDRLYDELAALERATGFVPAGSPTQRVGFGVSGELVKQEHSVPMLSLNKTKSAAELEEWLEDKQGLLSYKMDGLTVALTYENGSLKDAVTRGNGVAGEVVTNNALAFINLPRTVAFRGELLIRGEAVIRYSDFRKINREIEDVSARYKNPRNLASGSVRQLDAAVTSKRRVGFFAFALVSAKGGEAGGPSGAEPDFENSRRKQMEFLGSLGFETVEYAIVDAASLGKTLLDFSRTAHDSDFDLPVDGLVLEYDDIAYSMTLGATSKYPRDSIAFKWADEQAETTLRAIEWSASRTGLINPVAVFEPVELEGTTVSRASVHNLSIAEELSLGAGDRILVYKANMIIPQIAENLTKSGTERPPAVCPVCGAPTEIRDADGIRTLFCTNAGCAARKIKSFTHFVSRPALNIDGLSEQTLEKFIAAGLLHELADIFRLKAHREEIVAMDGLGERSFGNLTDAIETARLTTPARLLIGLGVPEVGAATAKQIAKVFGDDWDSMMNADEDTLSSADGVGPIIAGLYAGWFADPKNRESACDLLREVRFAESRPADGGIRDGGIFAGKVFVITGSLNGYKSRDDLKEKIEALGGKTSGSVSAKTDYLINNDKASASSKNKKAKELGVEIITESIFEEMAKQS